MLPNQFSYLKYITKAECIHVYNFVIDHVLFDKWSFEISFKNGIESKLSNIKWTGLGDPGSYVFGFVDRRFLLPGLSVRPTAFILSESLPISIRPRSLRYNYYLYGNAVLTVSYLTDVSVYNSRIVAAHNTSSIEQEDFTEGCVDLPFEPDVKVT